MTKAAVTRYLGVKMFQKRYAVCVCKAIIIFALLRPKVQYLGRYGYLRLGELLVYLADLETNDGLE